MILLADDDEAQRRMIGAMLTASGRAWEGVGGGEAALERLASVAEAPVETLISDFAMPGMDGLDLIRRVRALRPDLPTLMLTSHGTVATAVAAMRAGADDFLVKPVAPERLEISLRNAMKLRGLAGDVRRLSGGTAGRLAFEDLIARAPATRAAVDAARRAAVSGAPILIEGESGVGKEVFARAIHGASARAGGPFVAVNCGAIPEALVESILFGHEKGAFTGASARRDGKFQEAAGGTLFLDEIGELPLDAQVKLLRALQEGEVDPVGAARPEPTDIRLISATNRTLADEVAASRFRADLFYRVSVIPLQIPPLRERLEDIAPLAQAFTRRIATTEGKTLDGLEPDALGALEARSWPGNVRELENALHRAIVMSEGPTLTSNDIAATAMAPPRIHAAAPHADEQAPAAGHDRSDRSAALSDPMEMMIGADGHVRPLSDLERAQITLALRRYRGRMSEAARRLGIGRSTLYRKLKEYGVEV